MNSSIEILSRELMERLSTEWERPPATPATQLVGGVVKCGAKLEALLREMVCTVARFDGVSPEDLLAPTRGRPLLVRKAMAGPLAYGLRDRARRADKPLPATLAPILDDLAGHDSLILGFINLRNQIAKEGREPEHANLAVQGLYNLVVAFRKNAGWS